MTVSGGRNNTITGNTFSNNGAWGILFVPYPDDGTPVMGQTCTDQGGVEVPGLGCVLEPSGNALLSNTFHNNGYFGNPSNSDFGQIVLNGGHPVNCFSGNIAPDGSAPTDLATIQPTCGPIMAAGNTGGDLLPQVLCDTGIAPVPARSELPAGHHRRSCARCPVDLPTMPDPCAGVPTNPWCPASATVTTVPGTPTTTPAAPATPIATEPRFTG